MRKLDEPKAAAVRADGLSLEVYADATDPYPGATKITRPNRANRMFNVRPTDQRQADL